MQVLLFNLPASLIAGIALQEMQIQHLLNKFCTKCFKNISTDRIKFCKGMI